MWLFCITRNKTPKLASWSMFKHPPQNLLRSAFTHEHSLTVYAALCYVNIYNVVINFTSGQDWRAYAEGCLLCVACTHSPVLAAPSFVWLWTSGKWYGFAATGTCLLKVMPCHNYSWHKSKQQQHYIHLHARQKEHLVTSNQFPRRFGIWGPVLLSGAVVSHMHSEGELHFLLLWIGLSSWLQFELGHGFLLFAIISLWHK